MNSTALPDCICDGRQPFCAPCVVRVAVMMRLEHVDSLSVSMIKRRLGRSVTGREASLLVEATKRLPRPRNGRYVDK